MARDEEEEQRRGFKVEDRRRFTESGDTKADHDPAPEPAPSTDQTAGTATGFEMRDAGAAPEDAHAHAEINFSTFIISLGTQALAHLGEIADPYTKQVTVDLEAARQMIDILGMLQTKTQANLDKAEADLMEGLLYDLRLRFVERSKR